MKGSLILLKSEQNVISYGRFTEDERMVVVVNADFQPVDVALSLLEAEVSEQEVMERILLTDSEGYTLESEIYQPRNGILRFQIPANGGLLLKAKKTE